MSTTLRIELTNAGCPVSTAKIVFQQGVGHMQQTGKQNVNPTNLQGQSTTGGTDARLDAKFSIRQDNQVPRCIAIDTTNSVVYVWQASGTRRPKFQAIPYADTAYTTGNTPIPIIADF